jgi:SAM-dependent methyltransferase
MPDVTEDPTTRYFEAHSTDYHPRRLKVAIRWVTKLAREDDELFDVGCGTGQVLEGMLETGISRLTGCDTATAALAAACERVDFTPLHGSILDDEFVSGVGEYRFVTMAAVLHHLVGPTRKASREKAIAAIRNALRVTAPRGFLILIEPTYAPAWAMTVVFWAKRVLAAVFGNRRLEIGSWNNLGAPLVSYYSPDEIEVMAVAAGGRVQRRRDRAVRIRWLPRFLGVRGRWFSTFLLRRTV